MNYSDRLGIGEELARVGVFCLAIRAEFTLIWGTALNAHSMTE